MRLLPAFLIASLFCCAQSADVAKYSNKFAEVLRDGFVISYCSQTTFMGEKLGEDRIGVGITIDDSGLHKISNPFHCETEMLHKGETVGIVKVATLKRGKSLLLGVATLPHSLTRGIGAYEHQSVEVGRVALRFESSVDNDALVGQWLKIVDTPDQLGNTASMVVVKQVKLGMSFAEVEQALGLPITRVDLDSKVLYKYKDMTVEFHDGKVTDVR